MDGVGSGGVLSNALTSQATYVINVQVNFGQLGNQGSGGMPSTDVTPIMTLCQGGSLGPNVQTGLGLRSDGKLQFYRGATLIGAVSPVALSADNLVTFYDIEYKIVVGNPGSIEARVDGGLQIGPTAINTQNTASAFADSIVIANTNQGSSNCVPKERYNHIIAMDGTGAALNGNFIGPVDVVLLPPTGDGFYTAWALTGAANRFTAVQTNDGDTSYISASVVGTKNTFTNPGLPAGSTAVIATAVWAVAREDDAVTRGFKILMRNTVPTDVLGGTEFFVGPSYNYFMQPYEVSPFTGVAWTVAEINAGIQYGVQVTT